MSSVYNSPWHLISPQETLDVIREWIVFKKIKELKQNWINAIPGEVQGVMAGPDKTTTLSGKVFQRKWHWRWILKYILVIAESGLGKESYKWKGPEVH